MTANECDLQSLDWEKMDGLIPTIVQDAQSRQVLMLAYSSRESLDVMQETRKGTYYSRRRGCLWVKGETSGDLQEVIAIQSDCDNDTLLVKVRQSGNACHTGRFSCFGDRVFSITSLYHTILAREREHTDTSYTASLMHHRKGINKILEKVIEEAGELVLAAKDDAGQMVQEEAADLVYHLLVLLAMKGVSPKDIRETLRGRVK